MFPNLFRVVYGGLGIDPPGLAEDEVVEPLNEFEKRQYSHLIKMKPNLEDILRALHDDDQLDAFIQYMMAASSRQRSDDSAKLSKNIGNYLPETPDKPLNPHIDFSAPKSQTRGYYHKGIGALIVPLKYVRRYLRDPAKFRLELESGDLDFNERELPAFLYPTKLAYNPNLLFQGLFRGYLMTRIAFQLLPIDAWDHPSPEYFNLEEFYNFVYELAVGCVLSEDEDHQVWVKDVLRHFSSQMSFGSRKKGKKKKGNRSPKDNPVKSIMESITGAAKRGHELKESEDAYSLFTSLSPHRDDTDYESDDEAEPPSTEPTSPPRTSDSRERSPRTHDRQASNEEPSSSHTQAAPTLSGKAKGKQKADHNPPTTKSGISLKSQAAAKANAKLSVGEPKSTSSSGAGSSNFKLRPSVTSRPMTLSSQSPHPSKLAKHSLAQAASSKPTAKLSTSDVRPTPPTNRNKVPSSVKLPQAIEAPTRRQQSSMADERQLPPNPVRGESPSPRPKKNNPATFVTPRKRTVLPSFAFHGTATVSTPSSRPRPRPIKKRSRNAVQSDEEEVYDVNNANNEENLFLPVNLIDSNLFFEREDHCPIDFGDEPITMVVDHDDPEPSAGDDTQHDMPIDEREDSEGGDDNGNDRGQVGGIIEDGERSGGGKGGDEEDSDVGSFVERLVGSEDELTDLEQLDSEAQLRKRKLEETVEEQSGHKGKKQKAALRELTAESSLVPDKPTTSGGRKKGKSRNIANPPALNGSNEPPPRTPARSRKNSKPVPATDRQTRSHSRAR
ncbi:hypothetical protein NMY22_g19666 [Coprinellus aureogranulatus]|nr:hypothetical protein NMY22_g19666 [Coprinellus aureogranulatus]